MYNAMWNGYILQETDGGYPYPYSDQKANHSQQL